MATRPTPQWRPRTTLLVVEGENPILMAGVVACDEKALVEAVDRSAPPGFGLALLVTAGRGDDSEKGQTAWHRPARN